MADDDYSMGDVFRALKQVKQEQRADRREAGPRLLAEQGINIGRIENGGAHIIVHHGGQHIDYWPGTGLWIVRATKKRGRGVWPLIKHCRKAADAGLR